MINGSGIKPPPAQEGDQTGLGRILSTPDDRDAKYLLPKTTKQAAEIKSRHWLSKGKTLDQGATSQCVAFAGVRLLTTHPIVNKPLDPPELYRQCQTLDEWPGECVDMETQCLSTRGWLNGDELREGDTILAFDLTTGQTIWVPVERVHRYEAKPYREFQHGQIAIAVTDNHRWVVKNRNIDGGPYSLVETANLCSQHAIPRAAPSGDAPEHRVFADEFVEAVAWVACEGHYRPSTRRGNGIIVSQKVEKNRVAQCMSALGVAAGYMKSDGCHVWEISGEVATAIREIAPSRAPTIEWLRLLTRDQLMLFIDTCIAGDGCITEQDGRNQRLVFCQKPGPILDAFLAACTMAGVATSRATGREVETWTLRRSIHTDVRKMQPSIYRVGRVWCPQTCMGTFVARRRGSIFITGNSYDGTSVRALMKALKLRGLVEEYRWARDAQSVLTHVLAKGPVVMGTTWTIDMFTPDREGYIWPVGRPAGGHAWLIIGANRKKQNPDDTVGAVRMINSWGPNWGANGRAWLSLKALQALIDDYGEACTATEVKRV